MPAARTDSQITSSGWSAPRDADLASLHRLMRRAAASAGDSRILIEALATHPASREKLRLACERVLGRRRARRDLNDDIRQEAVCLVIEKIRSGRLHFTDQGLDRFGGWLWRIWHNACRDAWQRYRRFDIEQSNQPVAWDRIAASPTAERCPRSDLRVVLREIAQPELRQVMQDWAAGLNGSSAARLRGCSKSWISKSRARGLKLVRALLDADARPLDCPPRLTPPTTRRLARGVHSATSASAFLACSIRCSSPSMSVPSWNDSQPRNRRVSTGGQGHETRQPGDCGPDFHRRILQGSLSDARIPHGPTAGETRTGKPRHSAYREHGPMAIMPGLQIGGCSSIG